MQRKRRRLLVCPRLLGWRGVGRGERRGEEALVDGTPDERASGDDGREEDKRELRIAQEATAHLVGARARSGSGSGSSSGYAS
jgi:hypothetical protein